MPTDIAQAYRRSQAHSFALRGLAWSLGLFGLIRLGWFETHAVLPITQFQATLAAVGFGVPALPVEVSVACSGADAVALCAAAVLAYPAIWWMRLAGAAGGITLIVALNILRIGTLGRAAGSAFWFQALHVYVWPAVLMVAIAAYVYTWMRAADARCAPRAARVRGARCRGAAGAPASRARFVWSAAASGRAVHRGFAVVPRERGRPRRCRVRRACGRVHPARRLAWTPKPAPTSCLRRAAHSS